tara:strand:+ start:559 stop:804 length:246 start_codon:yes stop_codon:yes gene_type:complete
MSKMGEYAMYFNIKEGRLMEVEKERQLYDASLHEDENPEYQSSCCSSEPFGNSFDEEEETGICSKCYDGANFNDLNKDEGE